MDPEQKKRYFKMIKLLLEKIIHHKRISKEEDSKDKNPKVPPKGQNGADDYMKKSQSE